MGLACFCLAAFCHINIAFILLVLLPFPAPKHWKALLDLRIFRFLRFNIWNMYFICACPILLSLIDSVRDLWKYTVVDYELLDLAARKEARLSLLLAQRNFFISGGAAVLCLIVPRLISVLKDNADLSVKIGTVTSALKVFRQLVGVIEEENRGYRDSDAEDIGESETDGRVQRDILDALRIELEKLNRQHKIVEDRDTFEARELEQLLQEYERRRARDDARDRQAQQYRSRYHPPPALRALPFQQPRRAQPPGTRFSLF